MHCNCNRTFGAGPNRPASKPVPEGLDWESWLGPAPYRDYHEGPHPFNWRGYLDFGTGSIGDMGCHTMDGGIWALKLNEVDSVDVTAEKGSINSEGFAGAARIVFKFPARGDMPPVTLTWWNGGGSNMPPRPDALEDKRKQLSQGTYYYGSKGVMMSGSHCQGVRLIPEDFHKETGKPDQLVERVPGHTQDWIRACKDSTAPAPCSNFEYSTRLTEIVLLGTTALKYSTGKTLKYDFKKGEFTNEPNANELLYRAPRKGWEYGYKA